MKAESREIDLKEKYAPHERPDFTTSKKTSKRKIRPAAVDKASTMLNRADNYRQSNGRRVSAAKPLVESSRGNIARSYTYESILYDQIVSLESFLIIAKAASTGHDIDEVLSCVGSRARVNSIDLLLHCVFVVLPNWGTFWSAVLERSDSTFLWSELISTYFHAYWMIQESVDDDLKRYEGQLDASQGQSDTHRHASHISCVSCIPQRLLPSSILDSSINIFMDSFIFLTPTLITSHEYVLSATCHATLQVWFALLGQLSSDMEDRSHQSLVRCTPHL